MKNIEREGHTWRPLIEEERIIKGDSFLTHVGVWVTDDSWIGLPWSSLHLVTFYRKVIMKRKQITEVIKVNRANIQKTLEEVLDKHLPIKISIESLPPRKLLPGDGKYKYENAEYELTISHNESIAKFNERKDTLTWNKKVYEDNIRNLETTITELNKQRDENVTNKFKVEEELSGDPNYRIQKTVEMESELKDCLKKVAVTVDGGSNITGEVQEEDYDGRISNDTRGFY